MVQSSYKNWLLVSKVTRGIWTTSHKQWKVLKVEIRWSTFAQKDTFLQLKLDIPRIYLRLRESSSNCLSDFWNHKSLFTTPLLCIFLAQTFHTFNKSRALKCKFSGYPLSKFQAISFSLNFLWLFSEMRSNPSKLFYLYLYVFWTKGAIQSINFQTFDRLRKK